MPHISLLLTLVLQGAPEAPLATMRHAVAAIEGDSAAVVERRWTRRWERDSGDRLAVLGLAALAHLRQPDSLAERLYRRVLDAAPGDVAGGYAAINLTRILALRGRWLAAESLAITGVAAGRATGDPALHAEALVVLGLTRHRTAGVPPALATIESAEAIVPATSYRVRGLARCARAQMFSFAADARATPEALAGLELAGQEPDLRTQATCSVILASDAARRAQLDTALGRYGRVISFYRGARDRTGLAVALQWRSHLYRQLGWLAKARRDAEGAIVEAEASGARVVIPWARSTLALAALSQGDIGGAAPHAAEATRLFAAQGDRYAFTSATGLEGELAVAAGDVTAARAAFGRALESAHALGWAETEVAMHESLMHVALRAGDLGAAAQHLAAAQALALSRSMRGRVRSLTYFEGVLALRTGQLRRAERIFARRILERSNTDQPQWLYMSQARLAEILARTGRLAEAARVMIEAGKSLDTWRERLRDRELRLLAFQLAEDRSDPDLGIATIVNALSRDMYSVHAFEIAERSRARDLTDRFIRAAAVDTAEAIQAARTEPTVPFAEVRAQIRDDSTTILEYVTGSGGEPTTLFLVSWRDIRTMPLPAADSLAETIHRFAALIESGEDARPIARELGKLLIDPALDRLEPETRRLVIVPDGPLHRIPFDLLILRDGRFLTEHYAVSYAPSAAIAARLWLRPAAPPRSGVLVVADPAFEGETSAMPGTVDVLRSGFAGRTGLPRLRGSGREASAVARYAATATVRRRAAASESWLKGTDLSAFGVVHFATHALVDEASTVNTALALAPGAGEDGFASPGELAALKLNADLVVLSACRTAGGPIYRGEGVQGLASPLLAAGARAVAVTWWPIGDVGTIPMVEDFYSGLADGLVVSEALRAAKLKAIARGAPLREWGAFTIVGDPLARPVLRHPRGGPPWLPIAAGIVVVLAVAAVVVTRRRRQTTVP